MERAEIASAPADAEARGDRVQAGGAIEVAVGQRVEDVEAGDPAATAIMRRPGAQPKSPRTAIQAPAGPEAIARPRKRWQRNVKRFVNE